MTTLNVEQIRRIPEMRKTMTNSQIGKELGVTPETISRWVRRLKARNIEVHTQYGRRKIEL